MIETTERVAAVRGVHVTTRAAKRGSTTRSKPCSSNCRRRGDVPERRTVMLLLLLLLLLIVLIESKWRGILIGIFRIVPRGVVRIASPHRGCRLSSSTRDVVALLSLLSAPRAHSFRRVVGGGGGSGVFFFFFFFFFSKRFFSFVFRRCILFQNSSKRERRAPLREPR